MHGMDESIAVDLADAQQCKATETIKFLPTSYRSGNDKTLPIHDGQALRRAFEEVGELADCSGAPWQIHPRVVSAQNLTTQIRN